MMSLPKSITDLASMILEHTSKVESYYSSQGLPFTSDGPMASALPEDIADSRMAVLEAISVLQARMLGPLGILQDLYGTVRLPR